MTAQIATADIEERLQRPGLFEAVYTELRKAFGSRFRGLVIYGSSVRGEDRPDSDIDLMAVLDEPFHRRSDGAEITRAVYPIQRGLNRELSIIPVRPESLQKSLPLRFVAIDRIGDDLAVLGRLVGRDAFLT